MKPVGIELAVRCARAVAQLDAMRLIQRKRGNPAIADSLGEASMLLRLMGQMLSDDAPLTNWDVIDTQLHKIMAAGDVPTPEEAEKIMAVQKLIREVSGE